MKKQIRFISILMLLLFLTNGQSSAINVIKNENISPELAKAYLVYIDDMDIWFGFVDEDKDSFYTYEGNTDDYTGLLYADLIDFDNNGTSELLCIFNQSGEYESVNVEVLGFDGKELFTIHNNLDLSDANLDSDFEIRPPFVEVSANTGEVGITTVDGKTYLYYKSSDGTGSEYWINHDYYTIENGKWKLVTALQYLELSDYDDNENPIEEIIYTNNVKAITELEYNKILSRFEKSKKIIVTDFEDIRRPVKFNGYEFQSFLKEKATSSHKAKPTYSKVMVNNKEVFFDAYNIKDNNYFKLRDLASVFNGTKKQFEVNWNTNTKSMELISKKPYTVNGSEMLKGDGKAKNAIVNRSKLYIDGIENNMSAYNINDNNFFKLRDIAEVFNIGIDYNSKTNTILINTDKSYIKP